MQGGTRQDGSLQGISIWVIDDDIPLQSIGINADLMLSGAEPIGQSILQELVDNVEWKDKPLQELCREVAEKADSVAAFLRPQAALAHLRRGAQLPDVVVFDLSYVGIPPEDVARSLRSLLAEFLCVVQVYTNEGEGEATRQIEKFFGTYPSRLEPPRNKSETNAEVLSETMAQHVANSLSVRIAKRIRSATMSAVEQLLVRIDDLPLRVALQSLAGRSDLPSEEEFLEMLSVKVAEALDTDDDLASTVHEFALEKGVSEENSNELTRGIVSLVVSHVREGIRGNGQLIAQLESAWEAASSEGKDKAAINDAAVQSFITFQLYGLPSDDIVRMGDIVELPERNTDGDSNSSLYLVITAACDLDRFLKSTRGSLTVAKLYKLDEDGRPRVNSYGNDPQKPGSITSRHPMIFPTVPIADGEFADYVLFAHEISDLLIEVPDLVGVGKGNKQVKRPLKYSDMNDRMVRMCRLSEPYLSGVLSQIRAVLFRVGVPDFPEVERARLEQALKPAAEND